ncbi:NUDIX domain-containing protein [Arthrobacter sp. Sa2CUA1]|uniref:NUDIX domain-containing protein n=1 Tax=Arthrobacter gallicola TaxID=2762225 RepID=A0ABR8UP17_9MICC|nr:NUDIX domain-containing protein [Arthrobacter gallicola]MBD7993966.1 NUDIX domain-containing protein [Arthrobacter gallicola]
MITSAGILLYRLARSGEREVWIAHMGGPFWAGKDEHAWSIPKGEYGPDEDPYIAALREFEEEMGSPAPPADYRLLGEFRQSSRKTITVFCAESDFLPEQIVSNTFSLEWPPHSGRFQEVPEIDDAGWFSVGAARTKLVKGQLQVLDALETS